MDRLHIFQLILPNIKIFMTFVSDVVDDFLQSVYESYHPHKSKIQAFFEIINQQRGEVTLEDNRAWLTNSFVTNILILLLELKLKTK